jgi:hypothetical protein
MKRVILVLLPALALHLSACAEPTGIAPTVRLSSDAWGIPAAAVVVYSNFGPAMTFDADPQHAWTINGFLGVDRGQQAISQEFTPSGDSRFSAAQVALSWFQGPNSVRVFLQADANGLPGEVVEEIAVGGLSSTPAVFTASSALLPLLRKGTPYWLTVAAGGDGAVAGWDWNSTGDVSRETFASTQGGGPAGPWGHNPSPSTRSAFQVDGVPLTPQDGIQLLSDRVESLRAEGILRRGQADGLQYKLAAALQSLSRGSTGATCNQLRAFTNQVGAFMQAEALAPSTGRELTTAAESVRSEIGCEGPGVGP